jgi:hypothetical protein
MSASQFAEGKKLPYMLRRVKGLTHCSLYQFVPAALAMFNSVTRPDVMNWYAKTRFFHIAELTAWQVLPCALTHSRLHHRYRPTSLQTTLYGMYPDVVDWIPFPSIRDRIIQLHAANTSIDRIFCDAVSAYVVEATLSQLVSGGSPMKVFIRVTDLIAAISLNQHNESEHDAVALPAPDTGTLFSSPQYALSAFKAMRMDCGASHYKVDPTFFGKYSELYDAADDIMATGVPLRPDSQHILTSPGRLNASTVDIYRSFIEFSFDAAHEFSGRCATVG